MKDLISALNWRYATKVYDPSKKILPEQMQTLLEAIRLTPSSYGLEPWQIIVVENPEVRARLREAGYGQSGITDASHLLVFAAKTDLDKAFVDEFIERVAATREMPVENLAKYKEMIKGSLAGRTKKENIEWATRQIYIALGFLLSSAALLEIDACPMEGFVPEKFDEILNLTGKNLESKVAVSLGFRSENDTMAAAKKVRLPREELFIKVD